MRQRKVCYCVLGKKCPADKQLSKALTYMGMKSRVGQSRAVTQTMIEIARLLSGVQEDLSEFDISMWFQEYEGPPEGAELILSHDLAHYYLRPTDDVDPLYPPLASILRLYAKDSRLWESVTRTLIRLGVDVHAPVRRDLSYLDQSEYVCPLPQYGTPLDELFMYTSDPSEGQAAANGWLQILESEGFDISVYLETESTLHVKPMQLTHPSFRPWSYDNERKLVFDVGAQPSVSWDWWISPSSSASLIREEFKLMAISDPDWLLIAQSWKEAWPVKFPVWSELHQSYGDKSSCLRYKKLLESAETRATNRLAKKAQKLARLHRHKGPRKVPGAWPI